MQNKIYIFLFVVFHMFYLKMDQDKELIYYSKCIQKNLQLLKKTFYLVEKKDTSYPKKCLQYVDFLCLIFNKQIQLNKSSDCKEKIKSIVLFLQENKKYTPNEDIDLVQLLRMRFDKGGVDKKTICSWYENFNSGMEKWCEKNCSLWQMHCHYGKRLTFLLGGAVLALLGINYKGWFSYFPKFCNTFEKSLLGNCLFILGSYSLYLLNEKITLEILVSRGGVCS
jgi:hypothetical protein